MRALGILTVTTLLVAAMVLARSATSSAGAGESGSERGPLVVFLVRHAEKADRSEDPPLTEAGHERAALLAATLRSAAIEHVHSSDFIRTRATASPIATARGLDVQLYDHRDLDGLVTTLRREGGRHLVVGHSSTTPPVVKLLGGEPGTSFDEAGEFDRLYVVTIATNGEVSTVLLRYGKAYVPDEG